ncbi:MAG: tRNA 5-methoxyuridine(34)/uridine 5-oxyacetic acid(34) synthase CmoB [Pseudomonadota bacterium]
MTDPRRIEIATVLDALGPTFAAHLDTFRRALEHESVRLLHGNLPTWRAAVASLPDVAARGIDAAAATPQVGLPEGVDDTVEAALRALMPWRKGPWQLGSTRIDTEWRSDFKFTRLEPHLDEMDGQRVLDVGGGNGYFTIRLAALGAHSVINVDPTLLFYFQFLAVQRYLGVAHAGMLPIPFEALAPADPFDTVLSMGVLYHRRAPSQHLEDLRAQLRPGGRLVLETLVTDDASDGVLIPADRYARMRNVWYLPSLPLLTHWLERAGFDGIQVVDVTATTVDEQRATDWMRFESLSDALDPVDSNRTIEGHPGPLRAIVLATRDH